MAIFPFVRQFAAIDPDWFAAQSLFHLSCWLNEHLASRLFADAMLRVAPWREGDRPLIFSNDEDRRGSYRPRSEEHTSELQSLMRISYAVFCLKKKKKQDNTRIITRNVIK